MCSPLPLALSRRHHQKISCRLFVGAEREFPFLSPPHRFGKNGKVGKPRKTCATGVGWLIGKGVASLMVGAHTRYFTIFKPFSPFLPSSVYHFFLSRGGQKSLLPPPLYHPSSHLSIYFFNQHTKPFSRPLFSSSSAPFCPGDGDRPIFSPTEVWK